MRPEPLKPAAPTYEFGGRFRLSLVETIADVLDAFLSPLRPWRWLRGGHWERWYVDVPVSSDVWHKVDRCSRVTGHRPTPLCRGTPTCETHRL